MRSEPPNRLIVRMARPCEERDAPRGVVSAPSRRPSGDEGSGLFSVPAPCDRPPSRICLRGVKGGLALVILAFAPALLGSAARGQSDPITLALPIECKLGTDCFIQNLVDIDPGPGTLDYACGSMTYDGHKGVDIRVPTMLAARDTRVLAAASGTVLRTRDGMADISVRRVGADAVKGKECGNGVVIAHAGGWQTQYCHLAKGSVSVRPGQPVSVGQAIGRVGLSGRSEFPHLHMSVSLDGRIVDPFGFGADNTCRRGVSLWRPELADALAYRTGFIVTFGFADRKLDRDQVIGGAFEGFELKPESPVLLAGVLLGAVQQGDTLSFEVQGPGGVLARKDVASFPRTMAEYLMMIGRRRPPTGWPEGRYSAHFTLSRNGTVISSKTFSMED